MKKTILILIILLINSNFTIAQNKTNHYFTFLNSNPNSPKISNEEAIELQKGHRANIRRLIEEKKMIFASPFDTGGGVFIFSVNSIEQVDQYLSTDPAVNANRFILETYEFKFDKGRIGKASDSSEWTSYWFIQFNIDETNKELLKSYNEYIDYLDEQNMVIIEGTLKNLGKCIILKENDDLNYEEYFKNHNLSKFKILSPKFKKLYARKDYLFRANSLEGFDVLYGELRHIDEEGIASQPLVESRANALIHWLCTAYRHNDSSRSAPPPPSPTAG